MQHDDAWIHQICSLDSNACMCVLDGGNCQSGAMQMLQAQADPEAALLRWLGF